jgi:hypothetical protein
MTGGMLNRSTLLILVTLNLFQGLTFSRSVLIKTPRPKAGKAKTSSGLRSVIFHFPGQESPSLTSLPVPVYRAQFGHG